MSSVLTRLTLLKVRLSLQTNRSWLRALRPSIMQDQENLRRMMVDFNILRLHSSHFHNDKTTTFLNQLQESDHCAVCRHMWRTCWPEKLSRESVAVSTTWDTCCRTGVCQKRTQPCSLREEQAIGLMFPKKRLSYGKIKPQSWQFPRSC